MKVFNSFWLPFFTLVFNMLMMPNALAQAKGKILYEFTDGGSNQPLTLDAKGNIYGTTLLTVFELTPNSDGSWSEQTIYTVVDGEGPSFVVLDGAGNLYGTVGNGGNHSC